MLTSSLDQLGTVAAETSMKAAGEYLARVGFTVTDYGAASEIVKRHCKAALTQALDDARAALDAGMGRVAAETFTASMRLAGIAAGREIAGR